MTNGNNGNFKKENFIKWIPVLISIAAIIFASGSYYSNAKTTSSDVYVLEQKVSEMSLKIQTLSTKLDEAEKRSVNMQKSIDNMYTIILEVFKEKKK